MNIKIIKKLSLTTGEPFYYVYLNDNFEVVKATKEEAVEAAKVIKKIAMWGNQEEVIMSEDF